MIGAVSGFWVAGVVSRLTPRSHAAVRDSWLKLCSRWRCNFRKTGLSNPVGAGPGVSNLHLSGDRVFPAPLTSPKLSGSPDGYLGTYNLATTQEFPTLDEILRHCLVHPTKVSQQIVASPILQVCSAPTPPVAITTGRSTVLQLNLFVLSRSLEIPNLLSSRSTPPSIPPTPEEHSSRCGTFTVRRPWRFPREVRDKDWALFSFFLGKAKSLDWKRRRGHSEVGCIGTAAHGIRDYENIIYTPGRLLTRFTNSHRFYQV